MTLARRKTIFQLTPLLDLLLIVIFAQYMEMKRAGERQAEVFEQDVQTQIAAADERVTDAQDHSAELEERLARAQEKIDRFDVDQAELREQFQQTSAQRDALAEFTAQVFKLPDDVIEELLSSKQLADDPVLRKTLEEFKAGNVREAIKHIMSYAEILKRCDLWEVYLDYLPAEKIPKVSLTAGGKRYDFVAETAEQFRSELFEQYKQMPQPKSLVIVLFGYDHGSLPFGIRRTFSEALRDAVQQMNDDSFGRTRFYASDLGDLLGIVEGVGQP